MAGTRIINAERISGPPLKLELNGVLEMDALEILLRTTGGFVAAARVPAPKDGSPISGVEQITLLPLNSRPMVAPPQDVPVPSPDATPPPPPPVFDASGARRVIGPDGQPVPDDQDGAPAPPEAHVTPSRILRADAQALAVGRFGRNRRYICASLSPTGPFSHPSYSR